MHDLTQVGVEKVGSSPGIWLYNICSFFDLSLLQGTWAVFEPLSLRKDLGTFLF